MPLSEGPSQYYPPINACVSQVVSFPQVPTLKPSIHLSSPIRATCRAHLILLNLITRTILGEMYRSFCSSLCTSSFLHSFVTSSLLGPNNLLNTLFSNTLSLRSFLNLATKFHTHTRNIYTYIYVYTQQYSTIVSNYNLLFSAWRHVSSAHAPIFRPA